MKSSLRMLFLTKSTYCDNALTNSIKKEKNIRYYVLHSTI